ncbi:Hypothetical protein J6896_04006 [Nakaseomyces glabratus]|nr:hypothetical protein J7298_04010 [Nakaseomyces glabratus]KAH7596409.1 hypothetical protein J7295_03980 [Nakaseomyces glabratus]KAH7611976.1 hypothetical protein J7292_03989 [Nakaseomyces glabratus]
MFGGGAGKLKRKSFFLFGDSKSSNSDGKKGNESPVHVGTPSSTFKVKGKESSSAPSNRKEKTLNKSASVPNAKGTDGETARVKQVNKPIKAVSNPLGKEPLWNSNPFLNDDNLNIGSGRRPENIRLSSTDSARRLRENNPFRLEEDPNAISNELKDVKMPSKARFSRPPPPPVNEDELANAKRISSIPVPSDMVQANHETEDLRDLSQKMNEVQINTNITGHKRQKSEAEKLVDDIDSYMNNQSLSPESIDEKALSPSQDILPPILGIDSERIDTNSILDSLYSNVPPLTVEPNTEKDDDMRSEEEKSYSNFSFVPDVEDDDSKSGLESLESDRHEGSPVMLQDDVSNEDILRVVNADSSYHSSSSSSSISSSSSVAGLNCSYSSVAEVNNEVKSFESSHYNSETLIQQQTTASNEARTLRVVNEDRPSFYLQATNTNDDDTTTVSSASFGPLKPLQNNYSEIDSKDVTPNIFSNMSTIPNADTSTSTETSSANMSTPKAYKSTTSTPLGTISAASESFTTPTNLHNEKEAQVDTESGISARSSMDKNSGISNNIISPRSENTFRLVSSYLEEIRLKYNPTSNFLEPPPNLPISIKQKNNLIQPKNIRVKLRTNAKQIGIKHGRVKQKLLTLETANENTNDTKRSSSSFPNTPTGSVIDHTKEFRNLLHKNTDKDVDQSSETGSEDYLDEIPGDEAYDSDDAMAPLREKKSRTATTDNTVTRSNTVVSYYTRKKNKLGSGYNEEEASEHALPSKLSMLDYANAETKAKRGRSESRASQLSAKTERDFMFRGPLHIANPSDSESD